MLRCRYEKSVVMLTVCVALSLRAASVVLTYTYPSSVTS